MTQVGRCLSIMQRALNSFNTAHTHGATVHIPFVQFILCKQCKLKSVGCWLTDTWLLTELLWLGKRTGHVSRVCIRVWCSRWHRHTLKMMHQHMWTSHIKSQRHVRPLEVSLYEGGAESSFLSSSPLKKERTRDMSRSFWQTWIACDLSLYWPPGQEVI